MSDILKWLQRENLPAGVKLIKLSFHYYSNLGQIVFEWYQSDCLLFIVSFCFFQPFLFNLLYSGMCRSRPEVISDSYPFVSSTSIFSFHTYFSLSISVPWSVPSSHLSFLSLFSILFLPLSSFSILCSSQLLIPVVNKLLPPEYKKGYLHDCQSIWKNLGMASPLFTTNPVLWVFVECLWCEQQRKDGLPDDNSRTARSTWCNSTGIGWHGRSCMKANISLPPASEEQLDSGHSICGWSCEILALSWVNRESLVLRLEFRRHTHTSCAPNPGPHPSAAAFGNRLHHSGGTRRSQFEGSSKKCGRQMFENEGSTGWILHGQTYPTIHCAWFTNLAFKEVLAAKSEAKTSG